MHSSAACIGTTPMTTARCLAICFTRHHQQSLIKTNKQSKSTYQKTAGKNKGWWLFACCFLVWMTINRSCILTGSLYKSLYLTNRAWISATQYPFCSIPASSVLSAFSISHPLSVCLTLAHYYTQSHIQ